MGSNGVDILLSPLAQKRFSWAIECKNLARIAVYQYYEQAKANATDKLKPLVVIKANHKQPLVIVSLEDFLRLYKNNENQPLD